MQYHLKGPLKVLISMLIALSSAALLAGEIHGVVKWDGKAPTMKELEMSADPVCLAAHKEAVRAETLVLGEGNTIANIFVRVVSGLPAGKKWDPPKEAVVLDQLGCMYVPHVIGVVVNQDLKILNSDGILHNVNVQAKVNRGFNLGMPKGVTEATKTFSQEELMINVKCDAHPWMKSYIGVMSHPFFSVTGLDGHFQIKGLPAGDYEIEAWHERLGTQTAKVTIAAEGDAKSADFTFSRPGG